MTGGEKIKYLPRASSARSWERPADISFSSSSLYSSVLSSAADASGAGSTEAGVFFRPPRAPRGSKARLLFEGFEDEALATSILSTPGGFAGEGAGDGGSLEKEEKASAN